ncbi:dimer_Tnp_hAT domain-containing protein [Trichonephila clavipes]|nr:dimer_Tnp_hAT domain-containing protein [Trichonephila clavipes]
MYPYVISFDKLNLSQFDWLEIEELEMQLIDFQSSSIWIQKFIETRKKLELIEAERLTRNISKNTSETASQVAETVSGVYGADNVTANNEQFWFHRCRSGIFDAKDAPHTGKPVYENVGAGDLEVACPRRKPKVSGSTPAGIDRLLGCENRRHPKRKKSQNVKSGLLERRSVSGMLESAIRPIPRGETQTLSIHLLYGSRGGTYLLFYSIWKVYATLYVSRLKVGAVVARG